MLQERLPSAVRPPGHGWTHECPVPASGHGRGGTPGPIPNPEVKPPSADGTAERVRGRAGRRWPAEGIRAREGGERIRAPPPSAFICAARQKGPCIMRGPFLYLPALLQDMLVPWRPCAQQGLLPCAAGPVRRA